MTGAIHLSRRWVVIACCVLLAAGAFGVIRFAGARREAREPRLLLTFEEISALPPDQVRSKIEENKLRLGWKDTVGIPRQWWEAFEKQNENSPGIVLVNTESLLLRRATILEYFLAYVSGEGDDTATTRFYLNDTRCRLQRADLKAIGAPEVSERELRRSLAAVEASFDWKTSSADARRWWEAYARRHHDKPAALLRLIHEAATGETMNALFSAAARSPVATPEDLICEASRELYLRNMPGKAPSDPLVEAQRRETLILQLRQGVLTVEEAKKLHSLTQADIDELLRGGAAAAPPTR